MRCVRVVIADRHPLVLRGLANLLNAAKNFEVIASCRNGAECIQAIRNESPDIALIGIQMSGIPGLDILAATTAACLLTRVIFLAASTELREMIIASATGAHRPLHTEAMLVHWLRQVAVDQRSLPPALSDDKEAQPNQQIPVRAAVSINSLALLTERECEIMYAVSEGLSNKEVGRRLSISEGTIKVHLHHIYHKLGINNRASLAALAATHLGQTQLSA